MKKVLFLTVGITAIIMLSGCGDSPKPTQDSGKEEVRVEYVLVENVQTEETITERVYIDSEYQNEVEYNSRVNTWDSGNNVTYWD